MIKNNPAPSLDTHASYYLKHLMMLMTEAGDGSIPVTKIYTYADRWGIKDWERFSEVITQSYDHFRKTLNDMAQKDREKQ